MTAKYRSNLMNVCWFDAALENRVRHESEGLMEEDTAVSMMNSGQHVP